MTEITKTNDAITATAHDELAAILGDDLDLGMTGLEETDAADRQIAALVWNAKLTDEAGDPIPANRFFNTVTEEVKPKVRLAILTVGKSHLWSEYNQAEGKTDIRCRSFDRITGEMADGTKRPCKGCPDRQWTRDAHGKPRRNCGEVYDVMGVDLDDRQPAVMRFKRTAHRPFKAYLNRHFFGKRIVGGKRADLPPFCVETRIGLEMVKGAQAPYAVPVFERGDVFDKDKILFFRDSAKGAREYADQLREVADAAESREVAPVEDASFDTDDFVDDDAAGNNGF